MYFKGLFFIVLLNLATHSTASELPAPAKLEFKPNKCVALHKSRQCFARVKVRWQSSSPGHYCLFNLESEQQVACWKSKDSAIFQYEFESADSVNYELRNMVSGRSIASASISVSWLYNSSNKRRRWRLF